MVAFLNDLLGRRLAASEGSTAADDADPYDEDIRSEKDFVEGRGPSFSTYTNETPRPAPPAFGPTA